MSKIRLLVVDIDNAGVGKYRFQDPHIMLQKMFNDEIHVDIISKPPIHLKDFYLKYDGIFMLSSMITHDSIFKSLENMKSDGLKIILDMDDYWRLPFMHPNHKVMESKWQVLVSRLKIADLITTTTIHLARAISKYNKNVAVIPNAINPNESQFTINNNNSDKVRVGWVGGSSHLEDFKPLRGMFNKLSQMKNVQIVMCGFDNQLLNPNTGEITKTDYPKTWLECEYIFTNMYDLDENYTRYLLKPTKEEYNNINEQRYRRIWSKPISQYGTCYNDIDIVIAPLTVNEFNKMKSQLKVLEAGFHKKPVVASLIEPYTIDCIHGQNAFLIDDKKNHKDWFKYVKQLILDESLRKKMGEELYNTISSKYNLENVTKNRMKFYKTIFENGK